MGSRAHSYIATLVCRAILVGDLSHALLVHLIVGCLVSVGAPTRAGPTLAQVSHKIVCKHADTYMTAAL